MNWIRPLAAGVLGTLMIGGSACGPRVVNDVALTPTTAKVTYVKRTFLFPETGIIECQRAEDGTLSNCKHVDITYRRSGG